MRKYNKFFQSGFFKYFLLFELGAHIDPFIATILSSLIMNGYQLHSTGFKSIRAGLIIHDLLFKGTFRYYQNHNQLKNHRYVHVIQPFSYHLLKKKKN